MPKLETENGFTLKLEPGYHGSGTVYLTMEKDGEERASAGLSKQERKDLISALLETL